MRANVNLLYAQRKNIGNEKEKKKEQTKIDRERNKNCASSVTIWIDSSITICTKYAEISLNRFWYSNEVISSCLAGETFRIEEHLHWLKSGWNRDMDGLDLTR